MKDFDPNEFDDFEYHNEPPHDFFRDEINLFIDCSYGAEPDDPEDYDLLEVLVDKERYQLLQEWLEKAELPLELCIHYWINQLYCSAAQLPKRDRTTYLRLLHRHICRTWEDL